MPKKFDRNTERVHLTLYSDQISRLQAMWPGLTLSDIVRQVLDKMLTKAEAMGKKKESE